MLYLLNIIVIISSHVGTALKVLNWLLLRQSTSISGNGRAMAGWHASSSRRDASLGLGQNSDASVQSCDNENCLSAAVWAQPEVCECHTSMWQRTSTAEGPMLQPPCRPKVLQDHQPIILQSLAGAGLGHQGQLVLSLETTSALFFHQVSG